MKRSAAIANKIRENLAQARSIVEAGDKAEAGLTAEQESQLATLKATRETLQRQHQDALDMEEAERKVGAVSSQPADATRVTEVRHRGEGTPTAGFDNHQEFLLAVVDAAGATSRDQVSDERLRPLAMADDEKKNRGELAFALPRAFGPTRAPRAAVGSDEQGNYADPYGGFSVVTSRIAPRPVIGFEGDPTESRVERIPMATPSIEMEAAVDKDHTTSVSGGLTISRRPETAAMSSSRQKGEMITMKATGSYGLSFVTEELLADSPISWIARLSAGFNQQWAAFALNERLRGAGGAERLGVLTALDSAGLGPTLTIAKESGQAADSFVYQNVIKMRAQCWGYSQAIWLANHDCYPQLAVLSIPVGVGGQLVYQQSLTEDRPDMLLGRPIFYTEYASTVGDVGDLILGNWSQYMDGEYQPIQGAESIHVRFLNNERALRFTKRDCGAPSWRVPLTPNKSTNKLSPFVVLAAR